MQIPSCRQDCRSTAVLTLEQQAHHDRTLSVLGTPLLQLRRLHTPWRLQSSEAPAAPAHNGSAAQWQRPRPPPITPGRQRAMLPSSRAWGKWGKSPRPDALAAPPVSHQVGNRRACSGVSFPPMLRGGEGTPLTALAAGGASTGQGWREATRTRPSKRTPAASCSGRCGALSACQY